MKKEPEIAVAGHLVADEIIYADGRKILAPGGISYNLASLLSVMKDGKIIPVCEIGSDYESQFEACFGVHSIVDKSHVIITPLPNVVNSLVYDSKGAREEWNSRIPEQLAIDFLNIEIDAILANFISGDDISIEDLIDFRRKFDGIIYCDYHSLALGRDNEGKRYFRKHPEWKSYISHMNIVQMNVDELSTLSGERKMSFGDIISVLNRVHALGTEIAVITLGRNGAVLSIDRGDNVYHIPPVIVENEVDPTGCGDTFAAVFLYNLLVNDDPLLSAITANRYAAAKATFSGIEGFKNIESIASRLETDIDPVKLK